MGELETIIGMPGKQRVIAAACGTTLIGERINPTNRRSFSAELEQGCLDTVAQEALRQQEAGAHVLDVNVGAAGADEVKLLPQAVRAVMDVVDVPVCLDSANREALRAALRVYPGKALVNSVNGEEHSLRSLLPVVANHGAAVIGLTMDDNGIPPDVDGRVRIAAKIVREAEACGIPAHDVVIDPLTMAVATDSQTGAVTLQAVARIRAELGVNVVLGASNVSFGLPERVVLNAAFLAMAVYAGMTAAITDVTNQALKKAVLAADVLVGRDDFSQRYIAAYRADQSSS
ncbi:MAG: dihydropteroate synthase [Bacillota bacterium]|jgi:5-methyltetrahydrofolate--homocysteine methyltransferase